MDRSKQAWLDESMSIQQWKESPTTPTIRTKEINSRLAGKKNDHVIIVN